MRIARMANLEVRITGGTDHAGGGDGPVVILMHGYGAGGDDLVPLAQMMPVAPRVRFVFPAAPFTPPELAMFGGRAWWPIDIEALQVARHHHGSRVVLEQALVPRDEVPVHDGHRAGALAGPPGGDECGPDFHQPAAGRDHPFDG